MYHAQRLAPSDFLAGDTHSKARIANHTAKLVQPLAATGDATLVGRGRGDEGQRRQSLGGALAREHGAFDNSCFAVLGGERVVAAFARDCEWWGFEKRALGRQWQVRHRDVGGADGLDTVILCATRSGWRAFSGGVVGVG